MAETTPEIQVRWQQEMSHRLEMFQILLEGADWVVTEASVGPEGFRAVLEGRPEALELTPEQALRSPAMLRHWLWETIGFGPLRPSRRIERRRWEDELRPFRPDAPRRIHTPRILLDPIGGRLEEFVDAASVGLILQEANTCITEAQQERAARERLADDAAATLRAVSLMLTYAAAPDSTHKHKDGTIRRIIQVLEGKATELVAQGARAGMGGRPRFPDDQPF